MIDQIRARLQELSGYLNMSEKWEESGQPILRIELDGARIDALGLSLNEMRDRTVRLLTPLSPYGIKLEIVKMYIEKPEDVVRRMFESVEGVLGVRVMGDEYEGDKPTKLQVFIAYEEGQTDLNTIKHCGVSTGQELARNGYEYKLKFNLSKYRPMQVSL